MGIFKKELEEKRRQELEAELEKEEVLDKTGVEVETVPQETFDKPEEVKKEVLENVNVFDLKNINVSFRVGHEVKHLFQDFNLEIPDIPGKSQVIGFAGPSGCGKSQLLRIISGLSKPQSGEVLVYGKPYTDKTHFPLIFQRYSNYDWMTVYDNLALPLKMRGMGAGEIKAAVEEMIDILGLRGHEQKWGYPGGGLSGGQCQRISIGRSILAAAGNKDSRGNQILLLDEATSALDIVSKHEVHDTLMNILYGTELDPTMIIVSHDPSELAFLCDKVFVLAPWPCRIHKVVDIDYGMGKRTREIKESQKCQDYAKEIEQSIREIE